MKRKMEVKIERLPLQVVEKKDVLVRLSNDGKFES